MITIKVNVMTFAVLSNHMLYYIICYYILYDHNSHYRFVHVQCQSSNLYLLTTTYTEQVGPTPQSYA